MVHFDVSNVVRALDEMKIKFSFLDLNFKEPAGTSRGVMHSKPSWFIEVIYNGKTGVGEISIIPGLSPEFQDILTFEKKLQEVITQFSQIPIELWMENEDEITFQPDLERINCVSSNSFWLRNGLFFMAWAKWTFFRNS